MNREGVLYVLSKMGIQAPLPRSGKNVQISCPLAKWRKSHLKGTDSRPSMGVSISDTAESVVNCFTCKWRGKLGMLVDEMFRRGAVGEETALHLNAYIADIEEVPLEDLLASVTEYDVRQEVVEDEIHDEAILEPFAGKTHRYLVKRGITIGTVKSWESGFDSMEKRVTFPVRNWRGHLVGLVGRGVHGGIRPIYKNYWKFAKGRYLFGEHKIIKGTTLIVVEGPLDAVSVWQALAQQNLLGTYSVGGLFGSDGTLMQVRKIVQMADDVLLFFDNDSAGWDGQSRLGKALRTQLLVRTVRYPDPVGGDPDELVRSGIDLAELFNNSRLFV